jgi:predicted Zn-dependent protease
VLVPLQECDKWLIVRIKEELSAALGIPIYIQTIDMKYPAFSRDRRGILIDQIKQRVIKDIDDFQITDAMKDLNLTKDDLDEEDNVIKLMKYLLRSYDARAIKEFEATLEDSKGKNPQWNADQLQTMLSVAVMPYRRKNVAYLGITSEDIYARDYNFLFGWANRLCGIMSYRRFTADFNNDSPNQERLIKRTLMQSLSSVGLIYGLKRCTDPTCARAYPHSLSEHDAKDETLCSECRNRFRTIFGQLVESDTSNNPD